MSQHFPSPPSTSPANDKSLRHKLVKDILNSRTFSRAARLSSFLSYVCEQALQGNAEAINEQQIGIHVFGRPETYNPSEDSIVRTQARLLRLRLEEYFAQECPNAPLILCIPKGSYVPVFKIREAPVEPSSFRSVEANHSASRLVSKKLTATPPVRRFWIALTVLFALGIGIFLWQTLHSTAPAEISATLWNSLFAQGRPAVIVPSDSTLILLEELTHSSVNLTDYLSHDYENKLSLPPNLSPLTIAQVGAHQYTSIADLNLAAQLMRLPEAGPLTEIRYARNLTMGDLKQRNVILIGGARANPWVEVFQNKLDFDVNYDQKKNLDYVINKHPRPGEQTTYSEQDGMEQHLAYGVVAYLPSIEGNGNALLVEGTSMAGTEAAADFLLDNVAFSAFAKQIGATRSKMSHFEVLLGTPNLGGNAPQAKILTYRLVTP